MLTSYPKLNCRIHPQETRFLFVRPSCHNPCISSSLPKSIMCWRLSNLPFHYVAVETQLRRLSSPFHLIHLSDSMNIHRQATYRSRVVSASVKMVIYSTGSAIFHCLLFGPGNLVRPQLFLISWPTRESSTRCALLRRRRFLQ